MRWKKRKLAGALIARWGLDLIVLLFFELHDLAGFNPRLPNETMCNPTCLRVQSFTLSALCVMLPCVCMSSRPVTNNTKTRSYIARCYQCFDATHAIKPLTCE